MDDSQSGFTVLLFGTLLCAPISAQTTQRVSVSSGGVQGNGQTGYLWPTISDDGRYVAFDSESSNLVPGDTNGYSDIFVYDRLTSTTELVSVATGGALGNWHSTAESISGNGRYVAFESEASNLVSGDTNGFFDVFVRDRQAGTTERVSVSTDGLQGDADSRDCSISSDGRYVSFASGATNLVPGDTNGAGDVFVHDRRTGMTEIASVASDGPQGNAGGGNHLISGDGRYVVFDSVASNLVDGDTNGAEDVFVRDLRGGTTELVSIAPDGTVGNGPSRVPAISADGRFVLFFSYASNLVPGDTGGVYNALVRDRLLGSTERISVNPAGNQANGESLFGSISADGRFATFISSATDLVPGDTNGSRDSFVRDRLFGTTDLVSVDTNGTQANSVSIYTVISSDGRHVAFVSSASNLVPGDTNHYDDVFVRDLRAVGFSSLCEPGIGGVIACPCQNPPSGAGRGCDNSAATGGAVLEATGFTSLSNDGLVFATHGEIGTALSIVMQGNGEISGGVTYGQGVRCLGGTIIRRLYIKQASGGSVTAPEPGMGDATVTARSASKGDVIEPGQSRWYLVYYRDSFVVGSCSFTLTFNATQTGQVAWSP